MKYMPRDLVLSEFEHTWDRHRGQVSLAAPILGMSAQALCRALYRARAAGRDVRFVDDIRRLNRKGSAA